MKLAISMWSYFRTWKGGGFDIPAFIREAKKAGAEGVELLDFFYQGGGSNAGAMTSEEVAPLRAAAQEALAETGLPCPIFSIAQNFAKVDPAERAVQLQKIRFGVDEAVLYGAGVVRVFAGDVHGDLTFDQVRAWIVEGLSEASKYAADHGIKLALENHGTLAGRGDQVRGLVEDVRAMSGVDALGANPDTGNFLLVNQPSHEAIRQVADLANMVHFKDFAPAPAGHEGFAYEALDGSKFIGTAVGEGIVELATCIQTLKDAGFDGWLSVEYEGEEDPMTAVPRSIVNARKYL
jgi:sugar phosphate isomerase/epimerase